MGSLCKRKTATARLKSGLMAAQPGRLPNTFLYSGCNAVWAFQSVATTCLQGTRKVEETCPTKPCGPVLSGTSILTLKSGYPFMQMESRKPFLANGFTVFKKNEENLHDPDGKEKKRNIICCLASYFLSYAQLQKINKIKEVEEVKGKRPVPKAVESVRNQNRVRSRLCRRRRGCGCGRFGCQSS